MLFEQVETQELNWKKTQKPLFLKLNFSSFVSLRRCHQNTRFSSLAPLFHLVLPDVALLAKNILISPSDCHTNYTLHQLGVFNELHPVKRRTAFSHCRECQRREGGSAGEVADKKSQKRAYKTAERGRRAAE